MYLDGFAAADRSAAPPEMFVFVAIEKTAPYLVSCLTLDDDAIRRGRASIREDLRTMRECLECNEWPGYPETIQTIGLPAWAT
jgi:hypothetical protein